MSILRDWIPSKRGPLVTPWSLFGRDSRIITLFGAITSSLSTDIVVSDSLPFLAENVFGGLMLLAQEGNDPVKLLINNRGGDVSAGLTIIEGMEHLQAKGIEVWTIDLGSSNSMATTILAAGTQGRRYALKRSWIHLHSGHAGSAGRPEDKESIDEYIRRVTNSLHLILAKKTKIPEFYLKRKDIVPANKEALTTDEGRVKFVKQFLNGETYLTPEEAKEAEVIDDIIEPGSKILDDIFALKKST